MMRLRNDPLSLEESVLTIPNGEPADIGVDGDFFYIDELTAPIPMSVNGRKPARVRVGSTMQGRPGNNEVASLRFTNDSGAPVTLRVLHGRGIFANPSNVVLQNPTFTLDAAAINSLIGTGTITPTIKYLHNETNTAVAPRSFSVQNTGAVDIVVTIGATPVTVPAGASPLSFAVNALGLRYPNIQVDCTGGGGGTATFIYES